MTKKSTKRRAWSLVSTVVLLLLLGTNLLNAQSTANYAFSTSTSGSLALDANSNTIDLSTGATALVAAGVDEGASVVNSIGFNFTLMGVTYTQFSASSNGTIQLGSTAVGTATYVASGGSVASPRIAAWGSDALTTTNGVRSKVIGTAPNRCLVIENNSFLNYQALVSPCQFQVRLYETTGVIEFVYGSMNADATVSAGSIGFSVGTATNTLASITNTTNAVSLTTFAANTPTASAAVTNLNSVANGSRRVYTFTPPATAPSDPTTLSFSGVNFTTTTVNWVDNSTNELRFNVIRATDAGFTQNVVVTSVATTTSAGTGTAYTSAQTGLSAGTTYFYRITANTEGVGSAGLTGSQATTAGVTYYWVGASGSTWATAANWNTNPAGGGTTRTSALTTDVLIVDGAGTTAGAATTISVDVASFSIGQLRVTSNTALTLASSIGTTRVITITGGPSDDFVIEAGSSIIQNNATNAIGFAFSGTGNTGNIAGTYTIGGSTSNVFSSTGGTGTLVTIASTGIINNNTVGTGSYFTGSVATMSFAGGSAYNVNGATTGVTVPLATWATTATLTFNSLTTATALTNNNQSFGNIVFNCSSLTSTFSVWTTSTTAVVKGDLTITAAGATAGTGIFRALTSGTVNINGNIIVTQGRFQSASSTGTLIVSGNTTNSANGIIDILAGTFSQRGTTFTNNGALTGVAATSTLQFLSFTNTPQTFAGTGTVTTNVGVISLQNSGGLTISHSNQIPILRANLFLGTITNSNKITFGTGLALNTTVQIGAAGLLTPGGSFDANPTLNLGTGAYNVIYAQESVARTSGFEIPVSRVISALTLTNSNGLTISGGNLATGTLTFNALSGGNITTNASNLLTVTGTTTGSIVRTLATAYVNGPMAITLPASLVTGSTYILPVGKSAINAFELVNPITNAGGTVTIRAEVVDSGSTGTPSGLIGTLSTSRYWTASITAGAANFTSSLIKLNAVPAGADAIASSTTLTGSYTNVGGTTITSTGTSLTSTAPAVTTLDGFYTMGNKAAATLSALAITPTGNLCTHALRTVTVTATPGGGAVTGVELNYSVNGVAQTPIAMTNTSGNDWTGDIPTVTPVNASVTWSVTATDVNSLTKLATGISYKDEPLLSSSANITSSVPSVCLGSSATLTANYTGAGGVVSVGAGASTSSATAASFFPGGWGGAKTQYIIRASELAAAGVLPGGMTQIGYVPTVVGQTYQGFQMLIGHTTQTTTTLTYVPNASLTKVYEGPLTNAGILPVANVVNNLVFGTGSGSASSFTWDGVSNIVISISWSLNPTASTSTATTMRVDNPGFVCSVYNQADLQTMAAMAAYTAGTATGSTRPKFVFTPSTLPTYSWSDGSSTFSTSNPVTVSPTSTTTYTATIVAAGCTFSPSPSITLNVATPPAAVSTTSTTWCPGVPTVSVSSNSGYGAPKYKWYDSLTNGSSLQNSYANGYTASLNATKSFYVVEYDTVSLCESPRTLVTATVNVLTITPTTPSFCGTGTQFDTLNVTSSDLTMTGYTWATTTPSASFTGSGTTIIPATVSLTETSTFTLAATDGNCTQNAEYTVGVYNFPTVAFTTTPNDTVCLGTPVTIGTGLAAGNFNSSAITFAPLTAPISASTLVDNGIATPALTSGDLDDGGWGAVPVGFNFNFFGTPYSTINVGTNGTLMFGTYNGTSLADFAFTTLPSTLEPFNMVGVLAMDNDLNAATPTSGKIVYWTQGTAPNRKFIVEYNGVREYGDTKYSTAQAIFYETTGVIEVHVTSSTNVDRNKLVGINNGNGTIGVLAYASGTTAAANNPIITSFAYRFSPPANYTTVWSPSGSITGTASGTNIFAVPTNIAAAGTTTYSLLLTNTTTGCTNALNPDTIRIVTLDVPTAPTVSGASNCGSGSGILTVTNAASYSSIDSIKWYSVPTGGTMIGSGATFTTPVVSSTTPYYVEVSNGFCNPSTRVQVNMTITPYDALVPSSNNSTSVCLGNATNISVTQPSTTNGNNYSLLWTCSNYTTSGLTGATSTSLSSPALITPTAVGTYYFTITGTDATLGCTAISYDTVIVIAPFVGVPKFASASASTICTGNSTTLSANVGLTLNAGIGTITTTEFGGGVYRTGFGTGDFRHQLLYTAAELQAAGFGAGNLTDLTFNVNGVGTGDMNDYTISLANVTPGTATTTTFNTATLTQVYTVATYTAVNGDNLHSFNTPFSWDGTSDLLVNICYNVSVIGGSSTLSATTPSSVRNVNLLGSAGACSATTGATFANRPWIKLGMTGKTIQSISWFDGASVVGTTNPINVSPTSNTLYTATMNISGCTDTVQININTNISPNAPTTTPSAHCGNLVPTCSASGASPGEYRWYLSSIGGIALAGEFDGTLSTYSIASTTTFYVAINNGTCESARTPVLVTVTVPNAVVASSSLANVCRNSAFNLSVSQALTGNTYALTWTANNTSTSGMTSAVAGSLGSPISVTPTDSGDYTYTVTAFEASTGCQVSSSVSLRVNETPGSVILSPTSATICAGTTVSLSNTNINVPTAKTIGADDAATKIAAVGVPYRTGNVLNNQIRNQYLILASELNANGIYAGELSGISFIVTNTPTGSMSNWSLSLGHTNVTSLTTTFETSAVTPVLTLASYSPVNGSNNHTFTTNFVWDGVSNLLVENCGTLSVAGSGCTMATNNTSFIATNCAATTTGCSDLTGTTVANGRPQMSFVVATGAITWSPTNDMFNNSNRTGAYSGGGAASIFAGPLTTKYIVGTNTNVYGCTSKDSVLITVNPAAIAPNAPTTVSKTSNSIDVTWNATANATGYRIDVATDASFSSMLGSYTNASVSGTSQSITGLASNTSYYIRVRAENGCGSSASSVVLNDTTTVSTNSTLNLTAYLQGLYLGGGVMSAAPFNADGVSPATVADTITVELHNPDGSLAYSVIDTLSTSGQARLIFPGSAVGNKYYIAILHRNSVQTWSTDSVLIGSTTSYDFSTAASQAFGDNMVDDGSGVFLIYGGDINQDQSVDFGDYGDLDIGSTNGDIGYYATDINGDSSVDFGDYSVLDTNSTLGIFSVHP